MVLKMVAKSRIKERHNDVPLLWNSDTASLMICVSFAIKPFGLPRRSAASRSSFSVWSCFKARNMDDIVTPCFFDILRYVKGSFLLRLSRSSLPAARKFVWGSVTFRTRMAIVAPFGIILTTVIRLIKMGMSKSFGWIR